VVSVRIKIESEREGENKSQANEESDSDLFYRGSVLANLLPIEVVTKTGSLSTLSLSNDHLDRVSFSSQSIGTLSPHKDHHNLVSLALITSVLRTRKRKKKSDPSARAQKNTTKLSLLVTNCFEWNWDLERF
jgi:hypothetical protein